MPPNDNIDENYLKRTVVKPSCPHLEGGPTYFVLLKYNISASIYIRILYVLLSKIRIIIKKSYLSGGRKYCVKSSNNSDYVVCLHK